MNRKSKSFSRRSSILKIDLNRDEDTGIIGSRGKRASRRVSFAETYQVKEFPRDSPRCWKNTADNENDENQPSFRPQGAPATITGLDKLLTGAIQTPYQDMVSECVIPEMSLDSMNIFDSNRTILDTVDMDTTNAAGNISLTDMNFQSEPSTEIKLDQVAILKALTENSSSLKPMQIYSPNRERSGPLMSSPFSTVERSPLKGLSGQMSVKFNYQDKENIIMHPDMLPSSDCNEEPDHSQPLYDVKNFLNNLFAPATASAESQNSMIGMMGVGGLEGSGWTTNSQADRQDVTRLFTGDTGFGEVEETKCVGGILGQEDLDKMNKSSPDLTLNMTVPLEETKPVGELVYNTRVDNLSGDNIEEAKVTAGMLDRITIDKMTLAMEETITVGEIISKTLNTDPSGNKTVMMEETKPIGGILDKSALANNQTFAMDETNVVGGIIDKTAMAEKELSIQATCSNKLMKDSSISGEIPNNTLENFADDRTVAMEEAKAVGGILAQTSDSQFQQYVQPLNQTMAMEETKAVGGILDRSMSTSVSANKHTANQSMAIEETKAVGGILDRSLSTSVSANKHTGDITMAMEETKAVGGILDRSLPASVSENKHTGDITMAMEETKAVGGILDRSLPASVSANKHTGDITMAMEETKAVGGILDRSLPASVSANKHTGDITMAMEETKAVGGILDRSLPASVSANKHTGDITMAMEETKAVGGILDRSLPASVSANKHTANQTMAMEETKAVGGILDRSLPASVSENKHTGDITMAMEETKAVRGILDRSLSRDASANKHTGDMTMAMEETKVFGGILDRSPSSDASANKHTANITMAMEETKAVGGILDHTRTKVVTANAGLIHDHRIDANKDIVFRPVHRENMTMSMKETKALGKIHGEDNINCHQNYMNKSLSTESKTVCEMSLLEDSSVGKPSPEDGNIDSLCNTVFLTNTTNIYVEEKKVFNQTVVEPQMMEETKCLTGYLQDHLTPALHDHIEMEHEEGNISIVQDTEGLEVMQCDEGYVVDEDVVFKKSSVDTAEIDIANLINKSLENECKDSGNTDDSAEVLKSSTKRSYTEFRACTPDGEEKTRDMTQSQIQLAKLKEMLINSKKKTAPQLRSGDMKTPSKLLQSVVNSTSGSKNATEEYDKLRSASSSPACKKQKIQSEMAESNVRINHPNTSVARALSSDIPTDFTQDLTSGIDAQEMPDVMQQETFTSGNETRSEHTHSSDLHSSQNKTSNSINMSIMSNKSFASSFNIPEGPLTLESFYLLTIRPPSKISRGRCSTVFSPNIDMEDLEELLTVELTLKPFVQAKKNTEKSQMEKINTNKETMEWLQKTLEETQPQIFQQCSQASAEELREINDRLKSLTRCCYNEASTLWKVETAKMVADALHHVQSNGLQQKAEGIVEDIRTQKNSVDELLASLDTELADLETAEVELKELQLNEEELIQSIETGSANLEEKRKLVDKLTGDLSQEEQTASTDGERENIRQQMAAQLLCVEWNLDEIQDESIVFTFKDDQLELKIDYVAHTKDKTIKNITFSTRQSTGCGSQMFQAMAVDAVDTVSLIHKFPTLSCLPQILSEVADSTREVDQFCMEVRDINFRHKLSINNNQVGVELWSTETLDLIQMSVAFDIRNPLSSTAAVNVQVFLGNLLASKIEARLNMVKPGARYLPRLIEAVDFQDLHR